MGAASAIAFAKNLLSKLENSMSIQLWPGTDDIPAPPTAPFADILYWENRKAKIDRYRLLFGSNWDKPANQRIMQGVAGTWMDILDWAAKKASDRMNRGIPAPDALKVHKWFINHMRIFRKGGKSRGALYLASRQLWQRQVLVL
ncbi:hypothetical protein HRbin36_00427 [bacterium HR36]|nr:hypothetical protein HRbin36_00427 [bacterium HR36]